MRVALVSNWEATVGCGVANFSRDWAWALQRAGHQIDRLFWSEAAGLTKGYAWDLVLYNWHPFLAPQDLVPPSGPYAIYLHDLPSHAICPIVEGASAVFAPQPCPGTTLIPYPVYDGPLPAAPTQLVGTTIGWSGIRGDGRDALQALCTKRGWAFNPSTEWLDTPAEVARLQQSTLIVLWYHASNRGQSLALSTACATGRPVLVNDSQMFYLATQHSREIYRAGLHPAAPLLEPAIDAVLDDLWKGQALDPTLVRLAHGWAWAISAMEAAWAPK